MENQKRLIIICGEPSGDLNAANLTKNLLQINPRLEISAVGGELLRKAGAEVFCDIKDLSVMGFFDVLKKLPKFIALKKLVLKKITELKPDAVIFVDFSGFNLRMSVAINNTIPTIYYTSPQVWASRQGRVKTIKQYISKLIVLFKFEVEFYKKFDIIADFVGHPLLDIVRPTLQKKEFLVKFGLSESETTVALLPGSRKSEIELILPIMLKAGSLINKEKKDLQFVIAKSSQVDLEVYNRIAKNYNLGFKIIESLTYDCLNAADFCLVCSGTATLETAIMQKPFAVVYKMGLLNYILYRPQVKLPYIGMANIVAGRKIVPEFIQFHARPEEISQEALRILNNPGELNRIKNDLAQVKASLGESGAASRAANIIMNSL